MSKPTFRRQSNGQLTLDYTADAQRIKRSRSQVRMEKGEKSLTAEEVGNEMCEFFNDFY